MIVLICVDDRKGMLFNHRRQSQDKALRAYILERIGESKLWMNAYTKRQFESDYAKGLCVDEDFLEKAKKGEYCFVENVDITPYLSKIEKIILFHWNRHYPGDFFFPKEILDDGWKLSKTEEFQGSSHEKITEEEYER